MMTRHATSWGLDTPPPDHWSLAALCAQPGHEPEDWHVTRALTRDNLQALATCNRCPVQPDCHTYYQTLRPFERTGTIGGGTYYDHDGKPTKLRYGRPLLAITNPAHNPPPKPTDSNLTTGQAARLAGVTANTIALYCQKGAIPAYRNQDGHWRITPDDLTAWLDQRRAAAQTRHPSAEVIGPGSTTDTPPTEHDQPCPCTWCHHPNLATLTGAQP